MPAHGLFYDATPGAKKSCKVERSRKVMLRRRLRLADVQVNIVAERGERNLVITGKVEAKLAES
jgi:hypothetical protein